MGLMDCVAGDVDEYIALAVRLGVDEAFRHELSSRLLAASEVIFEDQLVVSEHERVFEELLQAKSS
jgi:predicted O-linked N-acetylglucosamine transferase (SPINDLY family)